MHTLLLMAFLPFVSPALAEETATVELGEFDYSNEQVYAYKFNVLEAHADLVLTEIAPYIVAGEGSEIEYAVFEETSANHWDEVYRSDRVTMDGTGTYGDYVPHEVELPLDDGGRYAIGFYISEDAVQYWFELDASMPRSIAAWGTHLGTLWVTDGVATTLGSTIEGTSSTGNGTNDRPHIDETTAYAMRLTLVVPSDADGDSVLENEDCDDGDAAITAPVVYFIDADLDGFGGEAASSTCGDLPIGATEVAGDCDDSNDAVYPGADELCNGADDDCDGTPDDHAVDGQLRFVDADGDGYGNADSSLISCGAESGVVENDQDCDDANTFIFPGAPESCNRLDDDCDEEVDEGVTTTFFSDKDRDGFGDGSGADHSTIEACVPPAGYVTNAEDCDDTNPASYPEAPDESLDGVDQDCDGEDGALVAFDSEAATQGAWGCNTGGQMTGLWWWVGLWWIRRRVRAQ
jgi:hypothetical protein